MFVYQISAKYITNLFDREIVLKNEDMLKDQGIEDFIAYTINNEFVNSDDTLLNIDYLDIEILTHTPKNFAVKTQNGLYNFHTFINNCTQNYNIVYSFSFQDGRLKMQIKNIKDNEEIFIDTNVSDIANYKEVFKIDVISKVKVICDNNQSFEYFLFVCFSCCFCFLKAAILKYVGLK